MSKRGVSLGTRFDAHTIIRGRYGHLGTPPTSPYLPTLGHRIPIFAVFVRYVFGSRQVWTNLPSASMEKEALAKKFGALIRRLRLERGYSQELFGEVCRVDRTYVGMIERGEVNVTLAMVVKLAGGLEISLVDLFVEFRRDWGDPADG